MTDLFKGMFYRLEVTLTPSDGRGETFTAKGTIPVEIENLASPELKAALFTLAAEGIEALAKQEFRKINQPGDA